jgi:hypothetical protein
LARRSQTAVRMQVVARALLALAALVGASRSAEASTCFYSYGVASHELPVGCGLDVYVLDDEVFPPPPPPDGIAVLRGGTAVDVTSSVATTPATLDVHHFLLGCDGMTIVADMFSATQYKKVTFTLAGVAPGDVLAPFDGDVSRVWTDTVSVVAAGTCPTTVPSFTCTSTTPSGCEVDQGGSDGRDGGCSAGGSGWLVGLGYVALITRRRSKARAS